MAEDWKNQAPYQWSPSPPFDNYIPGECHCGRIQFHVRDQKPLASKFCHCKTCQKIHGAPPIDTPFKLEFILINQGAPFQWAAIMHKTDLTLVSGAPYLHVFNTSSNEQGHVLPCKVSCSYCSTLIMDEGRNMVMLFPTLLQLTDKQRTLFEAEYVHHAHTHTHTYIY